MVFKQDLTFWFIVLEYWFIVLEYWFYDSIWKNLLKTSELGCKTSEF